MDEKKREDIALFRYNLILPFLSAEELEWGVKGELLKRLVSKSYEIPHSEKTSLTEKSIRRYLEAYREKGFEGLKPENRSDIGTSKAIPAEFLEQAFILKQEEPRRSARKIIQIMEIQEKVKPGLLKPSTLSRHLLQNGMNTKELKKSDKVFRAFQADHPNQIWQSDVMYGPYLPDPDQPERKKRTYLVGLIDDCSRMVPHAEFYWQENLPHFENTLQKAIIKRGIPEVLYVDNGAIFSSRQLDLICAELGIRKIHCKPYSPEGKGKVERFFGTVRSDFLTELSHEKVARLDELNKKFWAWLEMDYHLRIHSGTKDKPVKRWLSNVTGHLKKIDEKQLQTIFLWRKTRKVNKLGLVSVQGIDFEVDSHLVGKSVEVRLDYFDLSQVLIYLNGNFWQKAKPAKISRWNTSQKKNHTQKTPPPPKSGIKYLKTLEQQHLAKKREHAKELLGHSQTKSQPENFTEAHFVKTVADGLGRKVDELHQKELERLGQAWQSFGPFEPALIHTALAKAIVAKGNRQHLSFYLQAIIDSHLNAKNNQKENS
jgi:putative transposase